MRWHRILAVVMLAAAIGGAGVAVGQVRSASDVRQCVPVKVAYAEKHWRDATPRNGREVCWRDASPRGAARTIEHFRQYRAYRKIATMKCLPGSEGFFVPNPGSCGTLACETGHDHISWWAVNPSSGAQWVYQLLGGHTYPRDGYFRHLRGRTISGGPRPSSFRNRLINHEIAGSLGRSSWTC